MGFKSIFIVIIPLVFLISTSSQAPITSPPAPTPTPTPAPAPAPDYVNLTDILSVAGPFHTFLQYLTSTKVIDTFQNQANITEEGITIFVPKDLSFLPVKKTYLANLTNDQLKSLLLFHALPRYYSLADFKNLSESNPVNTFAGNKYTLNFTYSFGSIHIDSGWTNTKVSSAVHSTDPVAIYQVDKVLLPEAIFGTDIPPTPAPAPAPDVPAADTPEAESKGAKAFSPKAAQDTSGSEIMKWGAWNYLVLVVLGVFLW